MAHTSRHKFLSAACACTFLFFASLDVMRNTRLYIAIINGVYPDPKIYTAPKPGASSNSTPPHPSSLHGLRAIVTGLEHSGTTLIGLLLINTPCIMGAYETGYLVASSPKHIEEAIPWYGWNAAGAKIKDIGYRLTKENMDIMRKTANFLDMYKILRQRSYLFNELNEEEYCTKPTEMIDKTPRYATPQYFEGVLKKTPGVPVIVARKKFDKLAESWRKRGSILTQEFYDETYENVHKMKLKYPNRILVIDEEDLMAHPRAVMIDVFHHVGLEWNSDFLQMKGLLKKFSNDTKMLEQIERWKFSPGKHSPDRERQDNATSAT